jgi:hypothetical protein
MRFFLISQSYKNRNLYNSLLHHAFSVSRFSELRVKNLLDPLTNYPLLHGSKNRNRCNSATKQMTRWATINTVRSFAYSWSANPATEENHGTTTQTARSGPRTAAHQTLSPTHRRCQFTCDNVPGLYTQDPPGVYTQSVLGVYGQDVPVS